MAFSWSAFIFGLFQTSLDRKCKVVADSGWWWLWCQGRNLWLKALDITGAARSSVLRSEETHFLDVSFNPKLAGENTRPFGQQQALSFHRLVSDGVCVVSCILCYKCTSLHKCTLKEQREHVASAEERNCEKIVSFFWWSHCFKLNLWSFDWSISLTPVTFLFSLTWGPELCKLCYNCTQPHHATEEAE